MPTPNQVQSGITARRGAILFHYQECLGAVVELLARRRGSGVSVRRLLVVIVYQKNCGCVLNGLLHCLGEAIYLDILDSLCSSRGGTEITVAVFLFPWQTDVDFYKPIRQVINLTNGQLLHKFIYLGNDIVELITAFLGGAAGACGRGWGGWSVSPLGVGKKWYPDIVESVSLQRTVGAFCLHRRGVLCLLLLRGRRLRRLSRLSRPLRALASFGVLATGS